MIIEHGGYTSVERLPKKVTQYRIRMDTAANTLILDSGRTYEDTYASFHYRRKRDTLSLAGRIGNDSAEILLSENK